MTRPGEAEGESEQAGPEAPEPVLRLKADAVDWREVEGQVVVLDRAGSVYLAINQSGAVLWPAIVQGATRRQLARILVDTFDIDPARAPVDVEAFVANLSGRNLLEVLD